MTASLNLFTLVDLEHTVVKSGAAIDALRGAHIFLTGGTGFFGQWLSAAIIHANRSRSLNIKLTILTRSAEQFARRSPDLSGAEDVAVIQGDVRSFVIDRPSFTHVIHAATDTSLAADAKPLDLMETIVSGTRRVLDTAVAAGTEDVLFISSGAVYGGQGALEQVPETYLGACDPLDRRSVYAESKRMAENLCAIYRTDHGLSPKIARAFAFVGPGMPLDAHLAIGNFIADAVARRPIEIKGDGTPMRSYLYAADLAAWLVRALVLGRPGIAYNIGSDDGQPLSTIAETVAQALGSGSTVLVRGRPQPDAFRSRYVPSIARARADLGVDVWTGLADAVRKTAEWQARIGVVSAPTPRRG